MIKKTALAAALAFILSPTMAFARPPLIFDVPALPDETLNHLCAFPVLVHGTGHGVFHVFFNNQGAINDIIITEPGVTLTFTNTTNGHSISTPSVNMVKQSMNGGTLTVSFRGLLDRFVVPGRGLVMADVGRLDTAYTFDSNGDINSATETFASGHQDNGLSPAICPLIQ